MRKKGMIVFSLILAVAVLAAGIWVVKFRVTERKATRAEIEAHEAYLVDWSRNPSRQEGMTDKELILALCQVAEQGEDPAVFYTSDSLGKLLRQCETVEEISLADGILTVTYVTGDGKRVTLRYWDDGWQSCGTSKAKYEYIEYSDVPLGKLYWLVNLTRGKEEMPFVLDERNRQIFIYYDII